MTTGIVDIVGRFWNFVGWWCSVHHLPRRHTQLILVIPLHLRQLGHISHIAMSIVGIIVFSRCPHRRSAQTITLLGRFD
ncbi:MAG: hypothetical protein V7L11_26865 [Nostoc sp.]|uniref:hypothetical protein n=1 Tax=Nostoc sp. TaxID=1180 RepID=UPI002FF96F5E